MGNLSRKPRVKFQEISLSVPTRAHLSVLDMTRFSPGRPGGGGVGFPLPFKCDLKISLSTSFSYSGPRGYERGLRKISEKFLEDVGFDGNFSIQFKCPFPPHSGLGSHTSLYTGFLFGANLMLGRPLSLREIRELLGNNYYEEGGPGFETGVGPAAILYSSFVILSDSLEILLAIRMPKDLWITAVIPKIKRKVRERDVLMNYGRILDLCDGGAKAREVLLNMYPKALRKDWKGVGDSILKLQYLGSKVAEILQYDEWWAIYRIIREMRSKGCLITGMSSLGPMVVGVSRERINIDFDWAPFEYRILEGRSSECSLEFSFSRRKSHFPLLDKI